MPVVCEHVGYISGAVAAFTPERDLHFSRHTGDVDFASLKHYLWELLFFFFQWLSLTTASFSVESTSESLDCPCSSYSFNFSSLEVLYYCILLVSLEIDAEWGRRGLVERRFGHALC